MNCNKIKRIIDEADRPNEFPLEAAGHLAGCPDCQGFADERAKLRELTGSVARVAAPANFNALLNERLSRVRSQRSSQWSSWLSPVGFLRVGTAAAGLVVVFVALQYGGILSTRTPTGDARQQDDETLALQNAGPKAGGEQPPAVSSSAAPLVPDVRESAPGLHDTAVTTVRSSQLSRPTSRSTNVAASRTTRGSREGGPPLFLIRDNNGDRTYPMIPVSAGMQQALNASAGRQQPRSLDISY